MANAPLKRHRIDMVLRGGPRGSIGWLHDIVRAACPRAIAFYLPSSSLGSIEVFVELDEGASDALLVSACESVQKVLNQESSAGWVFKVNTHRAACPCGRCGVEVGEPHRPECSPLTRTKVGTFECDCSAPVGGPHDWNCPLPKYTSIDGAIAEIKRLRTENEKLCVERVPAWERDGLSNALESSQVRRRRLAAANEKLVWALDEQTRFLAGLNLQDHPLREQKDRDAQVHRAMMLLRPDGARVDNEAMDAKVEHLRGVHLTDKAQPFPPPAGGWCEAKSFDSYPAKSLDRDKITEFAMRSEHIRTQLREEFLGQRANEDTKRRIVDRVVDEILSRDAIALPNMVYVSVEGSDHQVVRAGDLVSLKRDATGKPHVIVTPKDAP